MTCDLQAIRERQRDRRLWYQPNPGEPTWTEVGDLLAEVDRLRAAIEQHRKEVAAKPGRYQPPVDERLWATLEDKDG